MLAVKVEEARRAAKGPVVVLLARAAASDAAPCKLPNLVAAQRLCCSTRCIFLRIIY
jgi:hypothetical protein